MIKILLNGAIMGAELVAVAAIAWLGWRYPFFFAGLTAALSLIMGLRLEHRRLHHELPFYFGARRPHRFAFTRLVGGLEALLKSILAGIAALFTFCGTDPQRLMWVAVIFAACLYAGSSLLRVLSIKFHGLPARWGYFRLAVPLGLLFSAGIAALAGLDVIASQSISDIGWKIVWDLPPRPDVGQVSELLFGLKQAFDDFVVTLLSAVIEKGWAEVIAIAVSVNVLTGFVAAVYSSLVALFVRRAEMTLL